jgi:hypothetical protein
MQLEVKFELHLEGPAGAGRPEINNRGLEILFYHARMILLNALGK